MDDRNFLAGKMLYQEVTCRDALLVVTAADTVDVRAAFFGQLRIGGSWRDLNDAFFFIDL